MKANHYDSFAESYTADNDSNLLNNYYERPAILNLVGEVDGRHVLDAGCGAGSLMAALHAKGATVTGFDASPAMIELARQRLSEDATLQVADLSQPLPFTDGAFDDVVASLVLHYLQDWTAPLAELKRVLKPGGRLILSVDHPAVYMTFNPGVDYFALTEHPEKFTFADGKSAVLTFWHRPLQAMTTAFTEAGYRIAVLSEPPYASNTPPELVADFGKRSSFLCFIFFVLVAD